MTDTIETGVLETPEQAGVNRWQVMRPLSEGEYDSLKSGIAEDGIVSSIVFDSAGDVIDGHHRLEAWAELVAEGRELPPVPYQKRNDLTEDAEIRLLARKLNVQRRQLSNAEKREIVKAQLRETPELADRQVGREFGVDHKTVSSARKVLEDAGEIPHHDKRVNQSEARIEERVWYSSPSESSEDHATSSGPEIGEPAVRSELAGESDPNQTTVEDQLHDAVNEPGASSANKLPEPDAEPTVGELLEKAGVDPNKAPRQPTEEEEAYYKIMEKLIQVRRYEPAVLAEAAPDPEHFERNIESAEKTVQWASDFAAALRERQKQHRTLRAIE